MKLERTVRYNPAYFIVLPLVNVLFVVLAFFALSSTFILQPGVMVRPPVSAFSLAPPANSWIVSLTSNPVLTIYSGDKTVSLEEVLQAIRTAPDDERTLIVNADRSVSYETVMRIANAGLQRGLSVVLATAEERQ